MLYNPDDFFALIEAVEEEGGAHLPEPCAPPRYRIKLPDPASGLRRMQTMQATGCHRETRFVIPYDKPIYERHEDTGKIVAEGEVEPSTLAVCAVDDDLGKWPRFAGAITKDSY